MQIYSEFASNCAHMLHAWAHSNFYLTRITIIRIISSDAALKLLPNGFDRWKMDAYALAHRAKATCNVL